MLLVCHPDLSRDDFDRLDRKLTVLPHPLRWARRADRLVVQVRGVTTVDASLQALVDDPAVDYVLRDPSPEEATRLFSRRDLLDVALACTGIMATACVVGPLGLYLRAPAGERSPHGDALVGRLEAIPVGGSVSRVIDGEDMVIIRRDEQRFVALTATCTHSEICLVDWDARRRQLVCPCHRGVFDIFGNVVSGPPPRPLTMKETVVRDGSVYVRRAT